MKNIPKKNRDKTIDSTVIDEKLNENRSNLQNDEIKSLFCYGDENVKKIIWALKTSDQFYKSLDGIKLMESISKEIYPDKQSDTVQNIQVDNIIVICAPSSSFWQNKKKFDHMHIFIKSFVKKLTVGISVIYVPHAITPRLNKSPQKVLNKQERQRQARGAYGLSNYFKYFLKQKLPEKILLSKGSFCDFEILIIDDVKTTGSTLIECKNVVERYIKILFSENNGIKIRCLTLAYEA